MPMYLVGSCGWLRTNPNSYFLCSRILDLRSAKPAEFFLLGTPKCGTTFSFEDFACSEQIVNYQPSIDEPSWHSNGPWVFAGRFDADTGRKAWLSHYTKCTQDKHMVAVDCTPDYFDYQFAPFGIQKAYRDSKHTLVFLAALREPVMRVRSHYYQYEDLGVLNGAFQRRTPEQFPKTFADAAHKRITTGSMCNCGCDDFFEDSMDVDFFKRYFLNLVSSLFLVVSFEQAVLSEVVVYAREILNIAKDNW